MDDIKLEIPGEDFPELIGDKSDNFKEDESNLSSERYIVFSLDGDNFAVSTQFVAEVGRNLNFTTLPKVPNWFLGIANLRGEIVSVIDLRRFWNKKTSPPQKTKTIIFNSPKDDFSLAVVVDRLGEIATLNSRQTEPLTEYEAIKSNLTALGIDKKALHNGKKLHILNPNYLLNSSKLHNLQAE
ncbi:MAG: chemotaxis protein CheW [Pyrinomonadaceae bacterium]|jgi:purine-binding chemotaxis protein CheW|nr:chemotaxis protein CheW [Pyrinomonadaceae bacterium]